MLFRSGIIKTKVDFTVGRGLRLFKSEVVDGKRVTTLAQNAEIEKWMKDTSIQKVIQAWATDLEWSGNFFAELISTKDNSGIAAVGHLDFTSMRSGYLDTRGIANEFFLSTNWKKAKASAKKDSKDEFTLEGAERMKGYNPALIKEGGELKIGRAHV